VNAEFSANGLNGNLFLKLAIDLVILRDVAAAMGTAVGQRRFEDFVDLIFGWNGSMSTLAVSGTFGPSGGLGILLGLALGEWRRLPLVGTRGLFELSLETIALGLETSVAFLQFSDAAIALSATRAMKNSHTDNVGKPPARSCATFVQV
jgi:hypothetical protein